MPYYVEIPCKDSNCDCDEGFWYTRWAPPGQYTADHELRRLTEEEAALWYLTERFVKDRCADVGGLSDEEWKERYITALRVDLHLPYADSGDS